MTRTLFLSYDGMTDPLGQSQVLPYLGGLSREGFEVSLISFEKPDRLERNGAAIERVTRESGIAWHPLPYTRRPPVLSTVWDLARMRRHAERLHARERFELVHCRSYVPALVGLGMKRRHGTRFVFDMRGFWADEKVEAGAWKLENPLFRSVYGFFKRREADFVREADGIVSLTHAGFREMEGWAVRPAPGTPRRVIPCSADFDLFTPPSAAEREAARAALDLPGEAFVAAYLGSLGTWYMLDEMLDFFAVLRRKRPGSRLLFVTPDAPEPILAAARERGIAPGELVVRSAQRAEVPGFLAAADLGLFFIRPSYSKQSSSPTKLGELLAMGLPVVTNGGVGDVEPILDEVGGGVVVDGFDAAAYERAVDRLDAVLALPPREIRERAMQVYDLRAAVDSYAGLYRSVLAGGAAVRPVGPPWKGSILPAEGETT
ncbi:MAG: glycosyltransferase [Gemmatimonadetes bacterium]|nr:glycosyltransferase [Gemmatimonadota bacterium]